MLGKSPGRRLPVPPLALWPPPQITDRPRPTNGSAHPGWRPGWRRRVGGGLLVLPLLVGGGGGGRGGSRRGAGLRPGAGLGRTAGLGEGRTPTASLNGRGPAQRPENFGRAGQLLLAVAGVPPPPCVLWRFVCRYRLFWPGAGFRCGPFSLCAWRWPCPPSPPGAPFGLGASLIDDLPPPRRR